MTSAVTAGGQLMFSHCTDRRWILLGPPCDPPRVLALRSSVQGAIGLQRSDSLPRRRGGARPGPPQPPRPRSHHGQGALEVQLDAESYSACLKLAELERRVREALAERERLLRAREARKAAEATPTEATPICGEATPTPAEATPPPEPDLLCALRARGHRPEAVGGLRILGGVPEGAPDQNGGTHQDLAAPLVPPGPAEEGPGLLWGPSRRFGTTPGAWPGRAPTPASPSASRPTSACSGWWRRARRRCASGWTPC
ncbi:pleckstrin homology-like domain family B member 3 [Poecile atricapillus]|uniref:pleckstrin homology-like domain family B member 3 n=1 Tax=Poecile atricapillus TaxID=48891 RepID=UPI002738E0DE|nr:pleckstrin homology-like domain family B member 3 [Poecile atricapillus]